MTIFPFAMQHSLPRRGRAFPPVDVEVPEGVYPDFSGQLAVTWVRTVMSQVVVAGDSTQFDTRYDMDHLGSSIDQAYADFTGYLSSHPESGDEVVQLAWIEDIPTLGQVANGNDTDFKKTYVTPSFFGGLCGNSPTSHSMTVIRSSASKYDADVAVAAFMAKVNEDVRTFGPSARNDGKLY